MALKIDISELYSTSLKGGSTKVLPEEFGLATLEQTS